MTSAGTTAGSSGDAPAATTTGQKVAAELIGTFVLVLFGCGSVVIAATYVAIALAFGLAVLVMVYAFGRVSGGHFNPAVSVGAAISGRIAWRQVPVYVVAQLGGAILGGARAVRPCCTASRASTPRATWVRTSSATRPDRGVRLLGRLPARARDDARLRLGHPRGHRRAQRAPGLAPLAIGLDARAIHFVAIPVTGTSVNPARSIGPALFAGGDAIIQLWLFILAPLVGAAIAGLTYPLLFGHGTEPVVGSGLSFSRQSAAAVPGYGAPDAFQQEWNQQGAHPAAQQVGQQWAQQPGQQSGQPSGQQSGQQTGQQTVQQPAAAPIIQDGWQWDPVAQQWFPVDQQPPSAAGGGWNPDPQQPGQQTSAQQWPDAAEGRTQIRPDSQG